MVPSITSEAGTASGGTYFCAGARTDGPDGMLAALDSRGKLLGQWPIGGVPVRDGLAATAGRLFVSTVEGKVICLGPKDAD